MIAHVLPGRIRLRHTAPVSRDELDHIGQCIREIAPSATLSHNLQSGRTLEAFAEHDRTGELLAVDDHDQSGHDRLTGRLTRIACPASRRRPCPDGLTLSPVPLPPSLGLPQAAGKISSFLHRLASTAMVNQGKVESEPIGKKWSPEQTASHGLRHQGAKFLENFFNLSLGAFAKI